MPSWKISKSTLMTGSLSGGKCLILILGILLSYPWYTIVLSLVYYCLILGILLSYPWYTIVLSLVYSWYTILHVCLTLNLPPPHSSAPTPVFRCLQSLGGNHGNLLSPLVPKLLSTHPFFMSKEPDMDDPACILLHLLPSSTLPFPSSNLLSSPAQSSLLPSSILPPPQLSLPSLPPQLNSPSSPAQSFLFPSSVLPPPQLSTPSSPAQSSLLPSSVFPPSLPSSTVTSPAQTSLLPLPSSYLSH